MSLHKRELRHHREALQRSAAELKALEAECARLGIAITTHTRVADKDKEPPHGH